MQTAEKYIQRYLQRCEESFTQWGYHYPPRDRDDFERWNTQTFQKHLAGEEPGSVSATKTYIGLLDHTEDFGFFQAIQARDYALLNNVLYQTSRQALLDDGMTAGVSTGGMLFAALPGFACNDFAIIDALLPRDLPLSKENLYLEISRNIFHTLHYQQKQRLDDAIEKAHAFLTKKQTSWTKAFVSYFLALASRNAGQLVGCLQELCSAYQKLDKFIASDLDNCFCAPVHGLYRLVRVFDESLFKAVKPPQHPSFWTDFEDWQAAHGYPQGRLFYTYPPEMDALNKILAAEVPAITLTKISKDKFCIDEKKFAFDLTENIKKLCNSLVDTVNNTPNPNGFAAG
jgi:hypothetical protein